MQRTINSVNTSSTFSKENMSQVSLTKGYWFYFDHEGNDISLFGSAWNGKEIVYFNNKPMSSLRNISNRKSEHNFKANGHEYCVKTEMTSILRGTVLVQLFCDGELIGNESSSQIKKGSIVKYLSIAAGFLVGVGTAFFVLTNLVSG